MKKQTNLFYVKNFCFVKKTFFTLKILKKLFYIKKYKIRPKRPKSDQKD